MDKIIELLARGDWKGAQELAEGLLETFPSMLDDASCGEALWIEVAAQKVAIYFDLIRQVLEGTREITPEERKKAIAALEEIKATIEKALVVNKLVRALRTVLLYKHQKGGRRNTSSSLI